MLESPCWAHVFTLRLLVSALLVEFSLVSDGLGLCGPPLTLYSGVRFPLGVWDWLIGGSSVFEPFELGSDKWLDAWELERECGPVGLVLRFGPKFWKKLAIELRVPLDLSLS